MARGKKTEGTIPKAPVQKGWEKFPHQYEHGENGKPKLKPEYRGKYAVTGKDRGTGQEIALGQFKSSAAAEKWIVQTMPLLRMSCSQVRLVKVRLVNAINLD